MKNMRLDKKQILFIIVFILLIISIVYRVLNPFVQPRVDKLTFTGEKISKTGSVEYKIDQNQHSEPQTLVSKFLNKPENSGKVYNDLFSMYRDPQKLSEKNEVDALDNKDIQDQDALGMIQQGSVLEAKEYIASYRFYGAYKSEGKKAVFLSKNKLVLVARIGDRLDGKYLIEDIQDNYVKIKALELNETIHLDMREFNNE